MRSVLVLFVVCAFSAAATRVPFRLCGSNPVVEVVTADADPWPPVPGQSFTVVAGGNVTHTITGGSYNVQVKVDGFTVKTLSGDVCSFDPAVKCPVSTGVHRLSKTQDIPYLVPPGSYSIHVSATGQDQSNLFCIDLSVDLISIPVPHSLCESDPAITILSAEAEPWPPVSGQQITLHGEWNVTRPVFGGTYNTRIMYEWITLDSSSGDICSVDQFISCPLQVGLGKIHKTTTVPSSAPPGSYKVRISADEGNGATLLCLEAEFEMN